MSLKFNLFDDELQIYMAESDEQFEVLDQGLVRLEQETGNETLIQELFRGAHTLKGAAGMIGHKRMVDVTHALETALDSVRKDQITVTAELIDICLEAVDVIRELRNEVVTKEPAPIEIDNVISRFDKLDADKTSDTGSAPTEADTPTVDLSTAASGFEKNVFLITAAIAQGSIASAARAFQILMALQENSTIIEIQPSQEEIEQVIPVSQVVAKIETEKDEEDIRKAVELISDIETITIKTLAKAGAAPDAGVFIIKVHISKDSIASAARAYQVLMVLDDEGEIIMMDPSREDINNAVPVENLTVKLSAQSDAASLKNKVLDISDVDQVDIEEPGAAQKPAAAVEEPMVEEDDDAPRLGDYLVANGYLTEEQLKKALYKQSQNPDRDNPPRLGKVLVQLGFISQDALDTAIEKHIKELRTAISKTDDSKQAAVKTIEQTVRTSVERLDSLMTLVGELITDRNRLYQIRRNMEARMRDDADMENLSQTLMHVGRITDQLQEEVLRIRMQPIANVFNKYPRLVRDLSRKAGKKVDLVMRGEDTEIDRSVIEIVSDPLIHLIRNSVDHGIEDAETRKKRGKSERGTVLLAARQEGGQIIITVQDDGGGIDPIKIKESAVRKGFITQTEADNMSDDAAVDLIFYSGLSTAKNLSEISGRGVGMDIVKTNIEKLNGNILVESEMGTGTQFRIILPLSLAIIPTLLAKIHQTWIAIPLVTVIGTHRIHEDEIQILNKKKVTMLRDEVLRIVDLKKVLNFPTDSSEKKIEQVVSVRSGKSQLGLIVDEFAHEEELMLKDIGYLNDQTKGVSGAAILGDGSIALILDIPGLFKLTGIQ